MAIAVARNIIAKVIRIEPIVVVIEGSIAVIPAIRTNQCLVGIAHAGIDVGDNQTRTINSQCPDVIGVHVGQVGFNGVYAIVEQGGGCIWFVKLVALASLDTLNTVEFL